LPLPAAVRAIGSLGSGGVVSVDGTTYWLANDGDAGKVVSLDLGDERLHASPLPVTTKPGVALTVVHGRLGVALDRNGKTDVWVLEGRRWSRRYEVQLDGRQRLTSPRFAHGKYVLTEKEVTERWRQGSDIYGHRLTEKRSLLLCNVSRSREPAVRGVQGSIDRAFAYVPTMEPLSVYASRL
jgi:F-box interacting protein